MGLFPIQLMLWRSNIKISFVIVENQNHSCEKFIFLLYFRALIIRKLFKIYEKVHCFAYAYIQTLNDGKRLKFVFTWPLGRYRRGQVFRNCDLKGICEWRFDVKLVCMSESTIL